MPAQQDRGRAGDLRRETRVSEQHHELRPRDQTAQGRARARAEIGPALPRAGLGVQQDNALQVPGCTLHEGDPRLP